MQDYFDLCVQPKPTRINRECRTYSRNCFILNYVNGEQLDYFYCNNNNIFIIIFLLLMPFYFYNNDCHHTIT